MTTLPISMLTSSIVELLTEAYAGPPNPKYTWFIDNEPDSGINGILGKVTAAQASISVDGSGKPGTTIASNVEHLRWSMANASAAMRGETYNQNWSESWQLNSADEAAWEHLRQALRDEFTRLCEAIERQEELPGEYLNGVLALIPHAAYHLGTIRQMVERVK